MRKVTFTPYPHDNGYRAKYNPEGLNVTNTLVAEIAEVLTGESWISHTCDEEYCYIFCETKTKPFRMELIEND